jgi:hypothetical protein
MHNDVQSKGNDATEHRISELKCGRSLVSIGSLPELRLADFHALQPTMPFIDACNLLKNNAQLEPIQQNPFSHSTVKKNKKTKTSPPSQSKTKAKKPAYFGVQELPSPNMSRLRVPKFPQMNAGNPVYKLNGSKVPHLRFVKASQSVERIRQVNSEIEKLHKITASHGMPLYKY